VAFGGNVAHIYQRDRGAPGWGQSQAWSMVGATPSVSTYDANFGASDSNVNTQIRGGFFRSMARLPLSGPTMNRGGRVSAQLNSLPAARFFQGYTGSGTGHNWSGGTAAQGQRMTHQNFNPNMAGAAEAHPAMTFDPFPSPSSLYPKVV
jgi:hypothetical protein